VSNELTITQETDFYLEVLDRLTADPDSRERFRLNPGEALKGWGVPTRLVEDMLTRLGKFTVSFSKDFDSKIVLCSSSGY